MAQEKDASAARVSESEAGAEAGTTSEAATQSVPRSASWLKWGEPKLQTWLRIPAGVGARPVVVFLHGMCAMPAWECPFFESVAAHSWLLCPPGPTRCHGQGAMWTGSEGRLLEQLDTATRELSEQSSFGSEGRAALVGYSLGAHAALRIVLARPKQFQRLMLVNAKVLPSRAQLQRAGVQRLVLVAGDRDRSAASLRSLALRLERQGQDAKFFALEQTGHFFDEQTPARLGPALTHLTADWSLTEPDAGVARSD